MDYQRFLRTYRALLYVRDTWDALQYAFSLEQMAQDPQAPYWATPTGAAALRAALQCGVFLNMAADSDSYIGEKIL
jgi:hypothetical protein